MRILRNMTQLETLKAVADLHEEASFNAKIRQGRGNYHTRTKGKASEKIAEQLNIGSSKVEKAIRVLKTGASDYLYSVISENMTLSIASKGILDKEVELKDDYIKDAIDVINEYMVGEEIAYLDRSATRSHDIKRTVNKRADVMVANYNKCDFIYNTPGKQESTKAIIQTIKKHIGTEFDFLSMPGNGREIFYLKQEFNINIQNSLGIEVDMIHAKSLQEMFKRLNIDLEIIQGDIDSLILEGSLRNFDVVHLDYNGFLTNRRVTAINKQLCTSELVFVTLSRNTRGVGIKYLLGKLPIKGEIIMHQTYKGIRGVSMEIFGIKK